MKKPLTFEQVCKLNDKLNHYRKVDETPRIEQLRPRGFQGKWGDRPLFWRHPPLVREHALRHLSFLVDKHKDALKIRGRGRYFGILCAIATVMAKRELGLIRSWKEQAFMAHRAKQYRTRLRTNLGLKDPEPRYPSEAIKLTAARAKKAREKSGNKPCEVAQSNLDGI